LVATEIEEVFKIVFEFGYVDDNDIFFELPNNIDLRIIDAYSGVKKLQNQI